MNPLIAALLRNSGIEPSHINTLIERLTDAVAAHEALVQKIDNIESDIVYIKSALIDLEKLT